MSQADPGQIASAIVLAAVALWLTLKAIRAAVLVTRKAALAAKRKAVVMPNRINSTLNTPVKRLGACFVAAGVIAVAVGAVQIVMDASSLNSALRAFLKSAMWVFGEDRSDFKMVSYGVPTMLLGLTFSLFYDVGVGRLIRWILYGQIHQREQET